MVNFCVEQKQLREKSIFINERIRHNSLGILIKQRKAGCLTISRSKLILFAKEFQRVMRMYFIGILIKTSDI